MSTLGHRFEPSGGSNQHMCALCREGAGHPIHTADLMVETATGAKRSTEYPPGSKFPERYDLMFRNAVAIRRIAETFGEGFEKYGPDNAFKGFKESVYITHALEHIRVHLSGQSTEDDLSHACWNLMFLMWIQENKPELMDLTKLDQKL